MEPNTQIVKASQSKEVEFVPIGSRDPIKLSVAIVKNFIAQKTRSGAEASDADCMKFVMLCKVRGLDPWQGDAYLQGYDSQDGPKFTLITAHQAFLKRAEVSKVFDGMRSGVVCLDEDGNLVEYEGDLVLPGHTLIGGWARVYKKEVQYPTYKRLKLSTFNTDKSRWKVDPAGMIVKCFDEQTEVLTSRGFEKFANAEGKILQVTESGLRETSSVPFFQPYTGPMVEWRSRNGNFMVTPNHDMPISLNGGLESKMEASELLKLTQRDKAIMPLTVTGSKKDHPISDDTIRLAAAYVSDGSDNSASSGFSMSVSRPVKVAFLKKLNAHSSCSLRNDAGHEAVLSSGRVITTLTDKTAFYYSRSAELNWLVGRGKVINHASLLKLSARQCRLFIDTWLRFDGHKPKSMLVGRIYTSRLDHVRAIDLASVIAGYSTTATTSRDSEGGDTNYCVGITNRISVRLSKALLAQTPNPGRGVWCVKVPSGKIVVRRHGFSSVCHQCTEADALRTAFPTSLGGLYIDAEVQNVIDITSPGDAPQQPAKRKSLPRFDAKPAPVSEEAPPAQREQAVDEVVNEPAPAPVPEQPKMSSCISSLSKSITNAGFTFEDLIEVLSKHPKYTARVINQWTDITDDEAKEIITIIDASNGALKLKAPRRQAPAPTPSQEGQP